MVVIVAGAVVDFLLLYSPAFFSSVYRLYTTLFLSFSLSMLSSDDAKKKKRRHADKEKQSPYAYMRISWFDDAWRSKTEQTAERLFCLTHYMLRGRVERIESARKKNEGKRERECECVIQILLQSLEKKTGILCCLFLNSIRKLLIQSSKRSCHYNTHTQIIHTYIHVEGKGAINLPKSYTRDVDNMQRKRSMYMK